MRRTVGNRGLSVFLSHNHRDKPFARKLADALEGQGIEVWFDEKKIKAGDSITDKIEQALKDHDVFIIVLSKHSVNAPWVREELRVALNKRLKQVRPYKIIPIVIDKSDLPVFLVDYLYVDFSSGAHFSTQLKKLLDSIIFDDNFLEIYRAVYPGGHIVERVSFRATIKGAKQDKVRFHEKQVIVPLRPITEVFKEIVTDGTLTFVKSPSGTLTSEKKSGATQRVTLAWNKGLQVGKPYPLSYEFESANEFHSANSWFYKIEAPTRKFSAEFRFDLVCAPSVFQVETTRSLVKLVGRTIKGKRTSSIMSFVFEADFPAYRDQFEFGWK